MELFDKQQPFGGFEHVVKIDELFLQGKRIFNRGRIQLENYQRQELFSNDSDIENVMNQRNHSKRIERYWLFGLRY